MRLIAAWAAMVEAPWIRLICALPSASDSAWPSARVPSVIGSLPPSESRKPRPAASAPVLGENTEAIVESEIAIAAILSIAGCPILLNQLLHEAASATIG